MKTRRPPLLDDEITEVAFLASDLATDVEPLEGPSTVLDDRDVLACASTACAMATCEGLEESILPLTETGPAPRSPKRSRAMVDAYAYLARGASERECAVAMGRTPAGTRIESSLQT